MVINELIIGSVTADLISLTVAITLPNFYNFVRVLARNTFREKNYKSFPALITLFEISKIQIKINIDTGFDILLRSYPPLPADYKCVLFPGEIVVRC